MSTRELLYMQCDRCGQYLASREDGRRICWDNHHALIRAAEAAGWRCQSESIGGDVCAACVEQEQEP